MWMWYCLQNSEKILKLPVLEPQPHDVVEAVIIFGVAVEETNLQISTWIFGKNTVSLLGK